MRLSSLGLLILPLVLSRSYTQQEQKQQPIQIYLHPTPPTNPHSIHQHPPTLSPDQAKAVLAHHLGEPIGDFEEVPNDISIWGHLVGSLNHWSHNHNDKDGEGVGKPRVVILDGVNPQEVLPTNLQNPSFYLESKHSEDLLAPYFYRAKHAFEHILDNLPETLKAFKDTFEMAGNKIAEFLGKEVNCLIAMVELPIKDNHPFEAVRISHLAESHGEIYETGRLNVQASLQAMSTPGSPPLLVIIIPQNQKHFDSRSRAFDTLAANSTIGTLCYSSNDTCSDATGCYGKGVCSLLSKSGDKECWGCKCSSGYAGNECQKEDYSVPFVILIFSTLLLLAMLAGSIALLFSVGDTKLPSTLTLAIGNPKRD